MSDTSNTTTSSCESLILTNPSQLSSALQCATLKSISISNSSSAGPTTRNLNLPNLQTVLETLEIIGPLPTTLEQITLPRLQTIRNGVLSIRDIVDLSSIDLSSFQFASNIPSQNSIFELARLPNMRQLSMPQSASAIGGGNVGRVSVTSTGLESLSGLTFKSVGALEVVSNERLTSLTFPEVMQIKSGGLKVTLNKDTAFSAPKIQSVAGEVLLSHLSNITLPSLNTVTSGSLSITDSPSLQSLTFQSLQSLPHGDLIIQSNQNLSQIALPNLETLDGSLNIDQCPNLKSLTLDSTGTTSFPSLQSVHGSILLNMPSVESSNGISFTRVTEVRGSMIVHAGNGFDCMPLKAWKGGVVLGNFTCDAGMFVGQEEFGSGGGGMGGNRTLGPSSNSTNSTTPGSGRGSNTSETASGSSTSPTGGAGSKSAKTSGAVAVLSGVGMSSWVPLMIVVLVCSVMDFM
ncbi:hypothetical protein HDU76_009239 [Blyttiomyces sp. JEL0837]|nr:hypothetical protein HDU76_009239 [Blyttiomyces sp. JEL0837]